MIKYNHSGNSICIRGGTINTIIMNGHSIHGIPKSESVLGNGQFVVEERAIANFDSLEASGTLKIRLKQTHNPQKLVIKGDANILPLIVTEVSNGELSIYAKASYQTENPIELQIETLHLGNIDISGEIKLFAEEIKADSFCACISGVCEVELGGQSHSLNVDISGCSKLKTTMFSCASANIDASGDSRIRMKAPRELNGHISGASEIEVRGNPDRSRIKTSGVSKIEFV